MPSPTKTSFDNGNYKVLGVLGVGGSATVYRVLNEKLKREEAVKLVVSYGPASLRERLRQEARLMARLAESNPNILQIRYVGEEEGADFVVMELAEGGSLQDRLEKKGPLSAPDAVEAMLQLLSALSTAHAAGIIHRDVKPHNLLLGRKRILLADFGIASSGQQQMTRTGAAMGSLSFMPPEQRLDAHTVGPSADLYAAGATFYALLTGGNPVDLFMAAPDSPRWAGIPAPLLPVLQKATAADPRQRYQTAAEMADALREAATHLGDKSSWIPEGMTPVSGNGGTQIPDDTGPATPPPLFTPPPPEDLKPPRRLSPMWFLLAPLLLVGGYVWFNPSPPSSTSPPAPPVPTSPSPSSPSPAASSPLSPSPVSPSPSLPPTTEIPATPDPKPAVRPCNWTTAWSGGVNGAVADLFLCGSNQRLTATLRMNGKETLLRGTLNRLSGEEVVLEMKQMAGKLQGTVKTREITSAALVLSLKEWRPTGTWKGSSRLEQGEQEILLNVQDDSSASLTQTLKQENSRPLQVNLVGTGTSWHFRAADMASPDEYVFEPNGNEIQITITTSHGTQLHWNLHR